MCSVEHVCFLFIFWNNPDYKHTVPGTTIKCVSLLVMFILNMYFFIACEILSQRFCMTSHSSLLFVWILLLSEDGWLPLQISILGYKADFFFCAVLFPEYPLTSSLCALPR